MVEDVEELDAELDAPLLVYREVFEHGKIEVLEARPRDNVSSGVPEGAFGRQGEGIYIKKPFHAPIVQAGIPHQFGADGSAADIRNIAGTPMVKGCPVRRVAMPPICQPPINCPGQRPALP